MPVQSTEQANPGLEVGAEEVLHKRKSVNPPFKTFAMYIKISSENDKKNDILYSELFEAKVL